MLATMYKCFPVEETTVTFDKSKKINVQHSLIQEYCKKGRESNEH